MTRDDFLALAANLAAYGIEAGINEASGTLTGGKICATDTPGVLGYSTSFTAVPHGDGGWMLKIGDDAESFVSDNALLLSALRVIA